MNWIRLFRNMAAVFPAVLLSACGGSYFVMPEEGAHTTYKEVESDRNGHFMLKLDPDCRGIVYRDFTILRNPDEPFPFKVYIGLNSRERAEWRVDP